MVSVFFCITFIVLSFNASALKIFDKEILFSNSIYGIHDTALMSNTSSFPLYLDSIAVNDIDTIKFPVYEMKLQIFGEGIFTYYDYYYNGKWTRKRYIYYSLDSIVSLNDSFIVLDPGDTLPLIHHMDIYLGFPLSTNFKQFTADYDTISALVYFYFSADSNKVTDSLLIKGLYHRDWVAIYDRPHQGNSLEVLKAIPNPFRNRVRFQLESDSSPGDEEVYIYDNYGKRIHAFSFENYKNHVWIPAGISSGVYYAIIQRNQLKMIKRITHLK